MTEDLEKETFVIEEHGKFKPRMRPNTPGRLKYGRTFLIGLAFFACSFAWTYYNTIMWIILRSMLEDLAVSNYYIDFISAIVMVIDNILAIIFYPIFGALSDRTKSKHGKHMPYIIIGTISAMIAFSVLGIVSRSLGLTAFISLIMVVFWFDFSMAIFRSPAVTMMPDLTDPNVRSTGNAIINLMGGVANVLGYTTLLVSKAIFGNVEVDYYAGGFYYVSIITLIVVLILYFTIKETPTGTKFAEFSKNDIATDPVSLEYLGEKKTVKREPLLDSLRVVFTDKDHSTLYMLLVIFIWFFGMNAITNYFSLYATQYLHWELASASASVALVPIAMIVFAYFAGKIAEWIGRRLTILIGLIGLVIAFSIIFIANNPAIMTYVFLFIGICYGMININTIVLIWEMAPKGKIGSYTGVYYFFSQLSDTLTPLIAAALFGLYLWITGAPQGDQYVLLGPYAIICELLAIFFLLKVKHGESEKYYKKKQAKK